MIKLSQNQMQTLLYFMEHSVSLKDLSGVNQITLWSLVYRGYLKLKGNQVIQLTSKGWMVVRAFTDPSLTKRKKESNISERVKNLLVVSKAYK